MRASAILGAALTLAVCLCVSTAAEIETVAGGLNNPCGVAIQPGTGHVFVADSGAKRVIRIVDGKVEEVIVDFPLDVYGKGPMYNIGPLGLAFLGSETLAVGGGGFVDDKELLRIYEVPAAGKPAIKADQMVSSFGLEANKKLLAEGNYYGVAVTEDAIFVSCNGDDTKGWVAKADRNGNEVSGFRRFIATKEATDVDAPVAVTISDRGQVVIGQMGEITIPEDGLVTAYDPATGEMRRNFEVGLSDITGLAQSPSGGWYATDFAWHDTKQGGLFRLTPKRDGGEQVIETVKVAPLDKPTALVFGSDGSLYVTVIGSGEGKLLRVSGL